MSITIVISILIGILSGYFFLSPGIANSCETFISIALAVLIFSVGIDISSNKDLVKNLKEKGFRLFLIPISIILGSLTGGYISGLFFNLDYNVSLSISSGFGWYSLSGIILSKLANAEIGTISFISNVFRELIAVISIPFVAKYFNAYSAIAPAGATSMDTTLPIISKATNSEVAIVAFCNGVILSGLVPILVPFFYSL
ncbi:hypothetical protein CLOACE_21380 [Clostridium acetireducens DSM 10703]|jgi:uncharacterized membrane protein YbjE (DUF340 family)|uniref:Lysine exporter LysO n=1 Tax=Clostridium acetireducens DSM 10703 TaxID=1121290 RepID=A0A1E8EWP5_9CLOT|nr:lysine exporter LysO family protein [Clostridium acetireducens]OFI01413.1 hypothetical protein CLOACE_21380 [Clostridium acetireducens DSM 10703]